MTQTEPNNISIENLESLLQGIRIPPQPQVLVDLQFEQFSSDPEITRIAELIAKDVGLSGTMLKIVNSAVFALPRKITSIMEAVTMLGIDTVVNIVNGISIKGELTDEGITALTTFWDNANDTAAICLSLAQKLGHTKPHEAYSFGLFHNVGIPLMMKRFKDYDSFMHESHYGSYERVVDIENERFKTNHCVVGYYIAKSWNLPIHLCDAIGQHHNTRQIFAEDSPYSNERKTLQAILNVAEHICESYKVFTNLESDIEWEECGEQILDHLALTELDLDDLKAAFEDQSLGVTLSKPI